MANVCVAFTRGAFKANVPDACDAASSTTVPATGPSKKGCVIGTDLAAGVRRRQQGNPAKENDVVVQGGDGIGACLYHPQGPSGATV